MLLTGLNNSRIIDRPTDGIYCVNSGSFFAVSYEKKDDLSSAWIMRWMGRLF